ncbi:hypothetical protein [Ferrimonas gelatinilytica]|uniref:DUF5681 domain-containing protein n=1 Tax=Ferrimonas gelatinilytica TaxID=1255257 RepID=A0ABP9S220_9GAMM
MTDRNAQGQFVSGNAAAKNKRGFKDRGRQLARLFTDADVQQVYQALMAKVADGDTTALSLISRYIAPPPKSTLTPTPFKLDCTDPISSANAVIKAAAAGELPADVARILMDAISGSQRIREVVELEARIKEIETNLKDAL